MDGEQFDVELDLTNALRNVASDAADVSLTLVAVDADRNEVAGHDVLMKEIELVVE